MISDYYVLNRDAKDLDTLSVEVDLIYLDPPFGLNQTFSMIEEDGTKKEFGDHWESTDEYIDWYTSVIEKSYTKLKKNGWLYAHNNHFMNALVLSKLSIKDKYYTNISWKRSHPHNNIKNGWGNIVDSILVFKKGKPYFEVQYTALNEKYAQNSFKNKDERGYYSLAPLTGEKSRMGNVFEYEGYRPKYGWRKSLEEVKLLHQNNEIHFGKNKPYKKMYLDTNVGVPIQNFWDDIPPITRREGRSYPTQKPIALLERIIKSSCPPSGIVLDPFCGGGTTLSATINLGMDRKCITSDISVDSLKNVVIQYPLYNLNTNGKDIWNND
jgi:DNA modification methylase